jgi:uncharacterized protein (TIGR02266 family)
MAHEAVLSIEGERALAELGPKLDAIAEDAIVRPNADPHGAAMTALLVADWLGQPERRGALAAANVSADAIRELGLLARIILATVTELGGEYLPDEKGVPGELVQRATALRGSMVERLDHALPNDPDVITWLEAIRLGSGMVDLVFDLRTLAQLHDRHAAELGEPRTSAQACAAADALEFALRSGESAEQGKRRNTLARAWTLFEKDYEKAASCARTVTKDPSGPRKFPPLALVASHKRARKRTVSVFPAPRKSSPPSPGGTAPSREDIEVVDLTGTPAPERPPSIPPMPAASRQNWTDARSAARQIVELEVGFSSESNFFVGVTENLSRAGVFVATYALEPVGSRISIALRLESGEHLRIDGVVRWHRPPTPDGWPGMGVQFDGLSAEDEAQIRKFLSVREPMLYDG